MDPTILYLNQIKYNLKYVDYDIIYQSIKEMQDKFVPTALIKAGHYIDRVRINKSGEVFTKQSEASYISDEDTIEKLDFGRANNKNQAIFYGALVSDEIPQQRAVAFIETTDIFDRKPIPSDVEQIFTVSRWKVLSDFEVIEVIFSTEALKVNEYVKAGLDNQLKNIDNLEQNKHYINQGKFFSDEFAKQEIDSPDDYKISAAYFNYLMDKTDFIGITYPSVMSAYKGQNVALLPSAVDKYLELESVSMFKFERKEGVNLPIVCIKLAMDLGDSNSDFKWKDCEV